MRVIKAILYDVDMVVAGIVSLILAGFGQGQPPLSLLLSKGSAVGAASLYGDAIRTYFAAEGEYKKGNYGVAMTVLEGFWKVHPAGTEEWGAAYQNAGLVSEKSGLNFGRPGGYYALRMLSECVKWRAGGGRISANASEARLSVVLLGKASGVEPRSVEEMKSGGGVRAERALEPSLIANDHKVLKDSLWLFGEYVQAGTRGTMVVKPVYLSFPQTVVETSVTVDRIRLAGLAGSAWSKIWGAVGEDALQKTDWWWVIYPSAVPEKHPDFKTMEFVTGGMGTGPDGISPCFIVDDRWLTRKPPHLGQGVYSDFERRIYLPQWIQHEFFHHLFRIYPEFGLEKNGHDWFNRSTWPAEFEGRLEPDYYAEALNRRFVGSSPSLAYRLKYSKPDAAMWSGLKLGDLVGRYVREPRENDWHEGRLSLSENGEMVWTNMAKRSWVLRSDLGKGRLLTGKDCPYFESGGTSFQVVLRRDATGKYTQEVLGFAFQGGVYARKP